LGLIFYSDGLVATNDACKAWLALREQCLSFEQHAVSPHHLAALNLHQPIYPPGMLPLLVDGDNVIFDAVAIMEYANELGPRRLLPADVRLRALARSLVSWQHAGLSNICHDLSMGSRPDRAPFAMSLQQAADAANLFVAWENALRRYGGPYLCGELSLADLAFVPTILTVFGLQPQLAYWPRSTAWAQRLLARASVQEWCARHRLDVPNTMPACVAAAPAKASPKLRRA
jgi:glutathione S-transferase